MSDLSQMSDADLFAAAGLPAPDASASSGSGDSAPLSHLSDSDLYKIAGIAPQNKGSSSGNPIFDATINATDGLLSGVSNAGVGAMQRINEMTSNSDGGSYFDSPFVSQTASDDDMSGKIPANKKSSLIADFYKAVLPLIHPELADEFQNITPDDIQQATVAAKKRNDQLKPDTTAGSVGNFAGQVAPLVALGPSDAGLLMQGATGGAISGALQPTTDQTADASGNQALLNTGIGAGVGAVAAPIIAPIAGMAGKAARAIGNKLSSLLPAASDAAVNIDDIPGVSDDIKDVLSSASPDVLQSFSDSIDNGFTPKQALIKAQAEDAGVPLTAGDITQDPVQQGREDLARTGAYGPDVKAIAQQANEAKQTGLTDLATNTAADLSNGGAIGTNEANIGNNIGNTVAQMAGDAKNTASAAYDEAFNSAATTPAPATAKLGGLMDSTLRDAGYDVEALPATQRILNNASNLDTAFGPLDDPKNIPIQTLEQLRKRINTTMNTTPNEIAPLSVVKGVLDSHVNNLIDNGLIDGDQAAIDKIKAARGLWSNYKQTYFGPDGKSIIGKIVKGNYTGEATMNMLIGANKAGANAGNAINNLKGILGADSPEFNQLKLAQFTRLWGNDLQGVLQGDLKRGSQGSVFAKNVDDLFTNNKTVADALYTPAEQAQLKTAARVTAYATTKQPGAISTSGTTPALLNFFNSIAGKIPVLGKYIAGGATKITKGLLNSTESLAFKKEFAGELSDQVKALNQSPSFARALGAKAAGVAGSDVDQPAMQLVGSSSTAQSNNAPPPSDQASNPINPLFKQAFNQINTPDFAPDPIAYAAAKTGSDPAFLASIAQKESGNNPDAKSSNSSATGLFQMTKPTWNALVDKYGKQYGVTKDMINDPKGNAVMASLYAQDNKATLDKSLGRQSTNGEVYMAHFLGPSGAQKLINNYSDSISAARLFPTAAKANRSVFFDGRKAITTQQLYQRLSKNIS